METNKNNKKVSSKTDPSPCFWESKPLLTSYFRDKAKPFRYYDNFNILNFLFFHWVTGWSTYVSKNYVESYKLHPQPLADQIVVWAPILGKNISDRILKLESSEILRHKNSKKSRRRGYNHIFLRSLFATFWGRLLLGLLAIAFTNVLSMSIAILVEKLLKILNSKSINVLKTILLLVAILLFQIADGLFISNFSFYMYRFVLVVRCTPAVAIFQHCVVYRRNFSNNVNGSNPLNVCNQLLHNCSPDSECSKNPLYCPAMRHQTKDISPQIFTFDFSDTYMVSRFFHSLINIVEFLSNFIYGIFLLSRHVKLNLWLLYLTGSLFLLVMIVVEVLNAVVFKYLQHLRDLRTAKSNDSFFSLSQIKKMFYDDIAMNIITRIRNAELGLYAARNFCTFLNSALYCICINLSFYIIKSYFVKSVNDVSVISDIDTAGFMTTFYIYMRIATSMFLIPISIQEIGMSLVSFKRIENCIKDRSPNFYVSDNKFTGSNKVCTDIADKTNQIPKDAVVYYKDATFTWVNSREDLLNHKYDLYLKNVNFELKRGHMAIVTGSQGAGKSNFIKSMLGEMTLVAGSMAVVPLYTSMPIFYASQDIWLQHGTIRSNIVFGHKFEEDLYNAVLKAVELEYDIATWEKGDMRVVSDNAHSLSGGQRVRMEMARAVYAYLVFHKVNMEYNEGKCSFLMCLDSSFHGLDPYVSKTIFNNLFNVKTGLLIKDDLSVVLTSSRTTLDIISLTRGSLSDLTLYSIVDKNLKNVRMASHQMVTDIPASSLSNGINHSAMIKLCESDENSGEGRINYIINKYADSLLINPESKMKGKKLKESFKPYIIYFNSIGVLFVLFVGFTFTYISFENFTYVRAGKMGDDIMEVVVNIHSGIEAISSYSSIRKFCDLALSKIRIFTMFIVIFSFLSNLVLTFCCLRGCKRLHEYCINSLLNNTSSVIKIKRYSSEILTFLSSDVFMIDENFGPCLSSLLTLFIGVVVQAMVIVYAYPICIPVVFISLFIIINFVFKRFVHASKNLQIASLESLSRNNFVCENAVSSSSTYRSFKKESKLLESVMEYTDYCMRSWIFSKSFLSWASFVSKFVFLIMTLFTFIMPILYKKFKGTESFVGFFGLNIMQNVRIIFTFTNFVVTVAKLEMLMCSIKRFECFIPPGEKCVFQKYRNIHKEDVIMSIESYKSCNIAETKKSLILRRKKEFKEENKKFYGIRKMGFKPDINIIITSFVLPDHSGVELNDVCVFTSPDHNPDGMILKHLTVSAHKSEIIGIIGRTGAGKTTLLSVLQNIVAHRTGQVMLDGKDLNDIPKTVLRQIIGVLPQLPFVFKGWTIRRFLDPRKLFTDDDINRALDQCGLLRFVNELPGGKKLDAVIIPDNLTSYMPTETNVKQLNAENLKDYYEDCDMLLSNTQLRTLSFARLVLYRNLFRIILVDEPPSDNCDESKNQEQDYQTEDLGVPIYQLLKTFFQHCTTFVTAHDSNALRMCNTVWIMHKGTFMGKCGIDEILKDNSISNIIQKFVK